MVSRRDRGLVIVNTGEGKGKSTAAFGVMLRGVARGWRVIVIQFVKAEKWRTGENSLAERLGVEWITGGDGFTWESENLERTKGAAREAWRCAAEAISCGEYDLVILDEATYITSFGWVPISEIVDVIERRPTGVNVIVTGRDADEELIEIADTVTEMKKIKHAFDEGIKARRGIDY